MNGPSRRGFLGALGASTVALSLSESIKQALAVEPNVVTGTIQDIKHIVVLMQENRSFDHYYGMLRGVRGFSDPRPVRLSNGNSVFQQPNGNGYVLPFHPQAPHMGYQFLGDLPHGWSDAHAAWNNGNNDRWVPSKGTETMAHMTRADIPFHYALADAFTICDAYHCSIMSSTDPNRYYLWTGWVGQNGTAPGGLSVTNTGSTPGTVALNNSGASTGNGTPPYGPVVNNDEQGYNWTTYPERLTAAGVTWRVYQDKGGPALNGDNYWGWTSNAYIGNYGDNSLLYFTQYQNAPADSPLQAALGGTNFQNGGSYSGVSLFSQLQQDVQNGTLPSVSWVCAPEAYCEHPAYPANWGAWYIANVLSVLTSNPKLWAQTALIINFDENDGFFDHVVPPTPPMSAAGGTSTVSTVNEIYPGTTSASYPAGVYGLGARVPLLVVSPWSKGGFVCSETFDHTSVIRFIEKRFGVVEPNITPWRRTICGDLTSAFNFGVANNSGGRLPATNSYLAFPTSTASSAQLMPLTQSTIMSGKAPVNSFKAAPPTTQSMPKQEGGQRLARALPYEVTADLMPSPGRGQIALGFSNTGTVGAFFHVRSALPIKNAGGGVGPFAYTLDPATRTLGDVYTPGGSNYDVTVHGPNGFYRHFTGSLAASAAFITAQTTYDRTTGNVSLTVTNLGASALTISVIEGYSGQSVQRMLPGGASVTTTWSLQSSGAWYDLAITTGADAGFLARYAGHVETGADSVSDPLIGAAA